MLQTQGGSGGTEVSPGRQKQASQDSGAVLGKYPAAAHLPLHGKIRSKKQLVPLYLHGVNSPALQWIPRQAHRPSRKSSKQWEKHSTLFLDKRPPQLPACCGKRQQRKEWRQRLKWGLHSPAWGCWQWNPNPIFSRAPREHHCGALSHQDTYPQHQAAKKGLFPNAFSQYWAFFKSTQKGTGKERPGHPEQGLTTVNHM